MSNLIRYKQKYNNEFKLIDTEAKAYFLGFFHADGNLHYSKTAYSSATKLKLAIKDKEILEKFVKEFPFFTIADYINKYKYKGLEKTTDVTIIRSYNKQLFIDLLNLEVKGNIPTNIPNYLIKHFIRGLIDGDGSYNKYSGNKPNKLFGMDLCMENITLAKKVGAMLEPIGIHPKYNKDRKIIKLRVRRQNELIKLINYLYTDASWYLKRKFKIINDILVYKNLVPIKSGELLENPEEDNQQPSLGSAESTKKVQRLDNE